MKCEYCNNTMRLFVMEANGAPNYWQCMVMDCVVINQ